MFILSDIHGNTDKIEDFIFCKDEKYCIQLGDFGLIFGVEKQDQEIEEETLMYLENKLNNKDKYLFTILGNHENYDAYSNFQIVTMFGALCMKITNHIYAVCRGEVLELEGKTWLCIGGADSHDKLWRFQYERTHGIPIWWAAERITESDYENALLHIKVHNNYIDYVLTHTPPRVTVGRMSNFSYNSTPSEEILQRLYDEKDCEFQFDIWFCGHMHDNYIDNHYREKIIEVLGIDKIIRI